MMGAVNCSKVESADDFCRDSVGISKHGLLVRTHFVKTFLSMIRSLRGEKNKCEKAPGANAFKF